MNGVARWLISLLLVASPSAFPVDAVAQPAPPAPGENIVVNGSFETPAVGGSFASYAAPTTFGNWTIASGSIDLIHNFWVSADGTQSLDMSGGGPGAIYQDLPTVAGREYTLSFQMAGNRGCAPVVKTMEVFWRDTSLGVFTFDTTGRTYAAMGWATHTVPALTATADTTRLRFVSLTPGMCGPALDDVQVVEGNPNEVTTLRLSKALIAGCLKTTGKVTLAAPAPAAGTVVLLSSSHPKVHVPASITLKAGVVTKAFPITTDVVAGPESAVISASTSGTPVTATLNLRTIGTKKVLLAPGTVVGGGDVLGTVVLECPAAPNDITATLWSMKPGTAVPDVATVVIPAGSPSADFGVTTVAVPVLTKASIKAKANGITKAKVLVVTP